MMSIFLIPKEERRKVKSFMRQKIKARISVLLAMLMVIPTIITCAPSTALVSQAANTYMSMDYSITDNYSAKKGSISVAQGDSFAIGEFFNITKYSPKYEYGSATTFGTKYKSSNTKVATVNSKGLVTAKKTGKTTITVSYSGNKYTVVVNVVKKSAFNTYKKKAGVADLRKAAKSAGNSALKGIKASNRNAIVKSYRKAYDLYKQTGFSNDVSEYGKGILFENYSSTHKLVIPEMSLYNAAGSVITKYASKLANNPFSTAQSGYFVAKSSKINSKGGTITMNKKLTSDQAFVVNCGSVWAIKSEIFNIDTFDKTATTWASVRSTKKPIKYYTAVVKMDVDSDVAKVTFNKKLPKGTYIIDAGAPYKFTVK